MLQMFDMKYKKNLFFNLGYSIASITNIENN